MDRYQGQHLNTSFWRTQLNTQTLRLADPSKPSASLFPFVSENISKRQPVFLVYIVNGIFSWTYFKPAFVPTTPPKLFLPAPNAADGDRRTTCLHHNQTPLCLWDTSFVWLADSSPMAGFLSSSRSLKPGPRFGPALFCVCRQFLRDLKP